MRRELATKVTLENGLHARIFSLDARAVADVEGTVRQATIVFPKDIVASVQIGDETLHLVFSHSRFDRRARPKAALARSLSSHLAKTLLCVSVVVYEGRVYFMSQEYRLLLDSIKNALPPKINALLRAGQRT